MFYGPLAFAGAKWSWTTFELSRGTKKSLDFGEFGVPDDARILWVNYTPQGGGLFPVELHGNSPIRHSYPREVTVYPMHLGSKEPSTTQVAVLTCWIQSQSIELDQLAEALDAYVRGSYRAAVPAAHTAIESAVTRLLFDTLDRWSSKERVTD